MIAAAETYFAGSDGCNRRAKVICVRLEQPNDLLDSTNNAVLAELDKAGLSSSIGLYFYRFRSAGPFIKIGECTSRSGISQRFTRGWHGTPKYSDSYLGKKVSSNAVQSDFLKQIKTISVSNPAYFVFYEHLAQYSHPKIDEMYAYVMHKKYFQGCGTLSPERMNVNTLLGRKLVWYRRAFREVVSMQLPSGRRYP